MLLFLTATLQTALAGCESPTSNASLHTALDRALEAYEGLDVEGFQQSTTDATNQIPCLSETLTPAIAARFHRFRGLRAFVERDEAMAELSFAAARALQPAFAFPESLVPAGNPVLDRYGAIDLTPLARTPVPPAATGRVWLDGGSGPRLEGLPVIFQYEGPDGTVSTSALLAPGAALPRYPLEGPPSPGGGGRGKQRALRYSGIGLLAVGGGLGLANLVTGRQWNADYLCDEPCTRQTWADAGPHAATVRGLALGGILSGVAGAGLLTVSFVVD